MDNENMETDDEIPQKEKDLAESLKAVCTPFGDERRSKLKESTEILFKMGKLYLEKATKSTGIKQKLDFVKCFALLHGARVRYEKILHDGREKKIVRTFLLSAEKVLLKVCGGKKCDKNLLEISSEILKKFKHLRKVEKAELNRMEVFSDNISEDESKQKQVEKIKTIQDMLERNTKNYMELMQLIADYCSKILGNLEIPCKFAIVGLGSLAREEITLYSDFEHVIILEEGIENTPHYNNVKEYFRWFTVIFDIIMIGLGETIIRSVGVKSINDLYSGVESKNWYYDNFTTSGVSFDGMVPHACSTPFGRPEVTKNRRHKVELIQPVSRMASYLTSDEDMKNGYYLKEILTRTCFVWGNKEIYDEFLSFRMAIMKKEPRQELYENIYKHVKENVNSILSGGQESTLVRKIDVKDLFYRPLTALLGYIVRYVENIDDRFYSMSNFILACNFDPTLPVLYALAVAHELRLKMYASYGCRRFKVFPNEIFNYVSKACATNCLSQVVVLYTMLVGGLEQRMETKKILSVEDLNVREKRVTDGKTLAMLKLGLYEDAIPKLQEEADLEVSFNRDDNYGPKVLDIWKIDAVILAARHSKTEPPMEWLNQTELHLKNIIDSKSEDSERILKAMYRLHIVYAFKKCYKKSFDINNQRFEKLLIQLDKETKPKPKISDLLRIRTDQLISMHKFMTPTEQYNYCCEALEKHNDVCSKFAFELGLAFAEIEMRNESNGRTRLLSVMKDLFQSKCRLFGKVLTLEILGKIFLQQMEFSFNMDAYETLNATNVIQESQLEFVNLEPVAEGVFLTVIVAVCYIEQANKEQDITKRKTILLEGINVCKLSQPDQRSIGISNKYHEVGIKLYIRTCLNSFTIQDVPNICGVYADAPDALKKDGLLKSYFLKLIAKLPVAFLMEEDSMLVIHLTSLTINCFANLLSHPFVFASIKGLYTGLLKILMAEVLPRDPSFTNVISEYPENVNEDHLPMMKNMFSLYEKSYFVTTVTGIWKKFIKGGYAAHDIHQLYFCVGLKLFIQFSQLSCAFVEKSIESYKCMEEITSSITMSYNKGVKQYIDDNFEFAAIYFWKTINKAESRSTLQIRSIVLLCHTIIKKPSDYIHCVNNGYLGLTKYEFHEGRPYV